MAADLTKLHPANGDTHHAEREKAELARRIAADFLAHRDGKGFADALGVMLTIATDPRVRARVRANTARAYAALAMRAAELAPAAEPRSGPLVNVNVGPDGLPRDRGFYQAILADPEGRRAMLAGLSAQLGVAPPIAAARPGKEADPASVVVLNAEPAPANGKAVAVNGKPRRGRKARAPK